MPDSLTDAARDLTFGSRCVGCGRPGRVLCPACRTTLPRTARPAWPSPTPPGLAPPFSAGPYDGLLKAMVLAHKEHGVLALAVPLGEVLAAVVGGIADRARSDRVVLVPVPSRRAVVRR
ncbi:MAG: ComF family protein, partial [Nocardioidaceae bacterium]|nr:ComF family protein [Nocardioidaceae bacterium]